jgi:hypothetical protein
LLARAVWDQDAVRDELRRAVCQTLSQLACLPTSTPEESPFPVLVIE